MTNGEKIKEIFPDINIYEHGSTYSINNEYNFNASWWNAEYKEPTTAVWSYYDQNDVTQNKWPDADGGVWFWNERGEVVHEY